MVYKIDITEMAGSDDKLRVAEILNEMPKPLNTLMLADGVKVKGFRSGSWCYYVDPDNLDVRAKSVLVVQKCIRTIERYKILKSYIAKL